MNIKRNDDNGFTLIELMIVVVIIGILASMAIPRFMEASAKSKQTEVQLILKQIYVNQRSYRQEANAYYQPAGAASAAAPQAFSEIWVEIMEPCKYTFTIVANTSDFTCTATANIDDDATLDTWTIDEEGNMENTIDDVTT